MKVSGRLHTPAALFPGKEPLYPLDRKLGGPQSRSGHNGEENKIPSLSLPRIEPGRLDRSLVTTLTNPPRTLYTMVSIPNKAMNDSINFTRSGLATIRIPKQILRFLIAKPKKWQSTLNSDASTSRPPSTETTLLLPCSYVPLCLTKHHAMKTY
jgi:hypothetical protein